MWSVSRCQADARGLLRGVVEQPAHLLRCSDSPRDAAAAAAPKVPDDAVGAQMIDGLKSRAADGHGHARSDVVAERHGAQESRPADAELLADRQSGGHHRAARMRLPTEHANRRFRRNGRASPLAKAASIGPQRTFRSDDGRDLLAAVRRART